MRLLQPLQRQPVGVNALTKLSGSERDWQRAFRKYPGLQEETIRTMLLTAKEVDAAKGTQFTKMLITNLILANFKKL